MRLIDADEFIQHLGELYHTAGWDDREAHFSLSDIRSNIDYESKIRLEVPTRCGTCRYWRPIADSDGETGECMITRWYVRLPRPDDYCSRAERKNV